MKATNLLGVASGSVLLVGSLYLSAVLVSGIHLRALHSKMVECEQFVRTELQQSRRYPTGEALEEWSKRKGIIPRFGIGERGEGTSYSILEGYAQPNGSSDFRIAYWGGERFEFRNSWDGSFTTSLGGFLGLRATFGTIVIALGLWIWIIRRKIASAGANKSMQTDASPAP